MTIIVDANIVFSAMLNNKSGHFQLLLKRNSFAFIAPDFLLFELEKHRERLLKLLNLSVLEYIELQKLVVQNIRFYPDHFVPKTYWRKAQELVKEKDPNDAAYVAMSLYFDATIWTGDRKISEHLKSKGFLNVKTTTQLLSLEL